MSNQEEDESENGAVEEDIAPPRVAQQNQQISSSLGSSPTEGVLIPHQGAMSTAARESVDQHVPPEFVLSFFSPKRKGWQSKSKQDQPTDTAGDFNKDQPKQVLGVNKVPLADISTIENTGSNQRQSKSKGHQQIGTAGDGNNEQPKQVLGVVKASLGDTSTAKKTGCGQQHGSPSMPDFVPLPMPMPTEPQSQLGPTGPGAFRMSRIGTGCRIDPQEEREEIEMEDLESSEQDCAPDNSGFSAQAWPIADPIVRATPYEDTSALRTGGKYHKCIYKKTCNLLVVAIMGSIAVAIISSIASPAMFFNNPKKMEIMQTRSAVMDAFGKDYFDNPKKERALHWIVYEDPRNAFSTKEDSHQDNLVQRFSLAAFYFQTSSQQPWVYCNAPVDGQSDTCYYKEHFEDRSEKIGTRWLAAAHECHWMGVFCSGDIGSVTELLIRNNNLTGTIPANELSVLTNLERLDLRRNSLKGSIPRRIFEESSMSQLFLEGNELTGTIPSLVFSLPSMITVDLSNNLLNGSIPSEIGFFQGLMLHMSDNLLTGPVPKQMYTENISKLLYLSNNAITGTLSTSVGFLTGLHELWLSGNTIHGPMPSQIGLLALRALALERTNMQGTFPEDVYQNQHFEGLFMSGSNFVGTISTRIGQLKDIAHFEVANNKLHGSIPRELSSATKLASLYLHGNADLTGSIPNGFCSHKLPNGKVTADCSPHAATGVPPVHCPLHCCSMCCDSETEICLEQ